MPAKTVTELAKYVGRTGTLTIPMGKGKVKDALRIRVGVLDARQLFGRLELKVTPFPIAAHGCGGCAWAQLNTSLVLDKEKAVALGS